MKKIIASIVTTVLLLTVMTGCGDNTKKNDKEETNETVKSDLQIMVEGDHDQKIIFQLNDSKAASSLYEQLPLTIEVEDYSDNEKIMYPPKKLDVSDAPKAEGPIGTLAYYEPWGDVVMFYDNYQGANGLYSLGEAISGSEHIKELKGNIKITKVNTNLHDELAQEESEKVSDRREKKEMDTMIPIQIVIDDKSYTASLYDTKTVRSLLDRLPFTMNMSELHGNEKYYYFSNGLPTSEQNVSQIHTGDIKLFGSDCLVLFYKDFTTSYSYTNLGQIDNPQGLAEAVGSGNVKITIKQ